MDTLPHGYGVAAEEPPAESVARCECGGEYDDHSQTEDIESADLLDALQQIDAIAQKRNSVDQIGNIILILDKYLTMCRHKNCTCRKFEEAN